MEILQPYPQLSFLYCLQWYSCLILWIHQLSHQRMQKEKTTCLHHQAMQQNAAFLFSGSPMSLIRNQQDEGSSSITTTTLDLSPLNASTSDFTICLGKLHHEPSL
uniref:Uncharacterized protein n=1 Tax=Arundo donax TaxID=35708 RepID=A0A0A9C4U9_ARUDO